MSSDVDSTTKEHWRVWSFVFLASMKQTRYIYTVCSMISLENLNSPNHQRPFPVLPLLYSPKVQLSSPPPHPRAGRIGRAVPYQNLSPLTEFVPHGDRCSHVLGSGRYSLASGIDGGCMKL